MSNPVDARLLHPAPIVCVCVSVLILFRIFGMADEDVSKLTEFGEDRVFNDLRYTINNDKLQALGWEEVSRLVHGRLLLL